MQAFPVKGQRPLMAWSLAQIKALAHQSVRWRNHGIALLCAEEASHRKTKSLVSVLEVVGALDIPPAQWLEKAQAAAKKVEKPAPGAHHVYVILLFDPDRDKNPFGLYVGQSAHPPATRFEQHRRGYKASKAVKKWGVCLLPMLYAHLNPFAKAANLGVEGGLADRFRKAGLWVEGGH